MDKYKYAVINYADGRISDVYAIKIVSEEALSASPEKLNQILSFVAERILGRDTDFSVRFMDSLKERSLSLKKASSFSKELFSDDAVYTVWRMRPELYNSDEIKAIPEFEIIAEI